MGICVRPGTPSGNLHHNTARHIMDDNTLQGHCHGYQKSVKYNGLDAANYEKSKKKTRNISIFELQ
jgi:hypothetical protein